MTITKKTLVAAAVTVLLVAAVGAPAIAGAVPSAAQAGVGRNAMAGALAGANTLAANVANTNKPVFTGLANARLQALGLLKQRIVAVLMRRKARFDAAAARMSDRIARVGALADRVGAAGVDVSNAKSSIEGAKLHLSSAKSFEAQAVAALKAVPNATDKRAAFLAARELGRQAGAELRLARAQLQAGIKELRTIVQKLKQSASTTGSSVQ